MCGINGLFAFKSSTFIGIEKIESMNKAIYHRGPDDGGSWVSPLGHVALGHRRLSILDLSSAAHQPMEDKDSGNCLVFNGEIYNYQELSEKYNLKNLSSSGDTEVLFRLLCKYGKKIINELNGMFSFAFWNAQADELILARDHLGIKPLYYYMDENVLAFSSEVKALMTLEELDVSISAACAANYFLSNRQSGNSTIYSEIEKVPPGGVLTFSALDKKKKILENYWNITLPNNAKFKSESECVSKLQEHLSLAVKRQLVSDVPVGAFLSGGVDSSAVVAYMSEYSDKSISSFSIGFEGADNYDERIYAEKVARMFGTNHHLKVISKQEVLDMLPLMVEIFDDPLSDPTSIPIYFLCKQAKDSGCKVVLTGDGADEMFLGYKGWKRYYSLDPYFKILQRFNVASLFWGLLKSSNINNDFIKEFFLRSKEKLPLFIPGAGGMKENSLLDISSIQQELYNKRSEYVRSLYSEFEMQGGSDIKEWMSYSGLKDIIPNYYLYRSDKLSSFNSIELRVPFLDKELVDVSLKIPGNMKCKTGEPKYILKKSLEGILPSDILYRKKMGFCVPVDLWVKDAVVQNIYENISSVSDVLNTEKTIRYVKRLEKSPGGGAVIWNLYFFINWVIKWRKM